MSEEAKEVKKRPVKRTLKISPNSRRRSLNRAVGRFQSNVKGSGCLGLGIAILVIIVLIAFGFLRGAVRIEKHKNEMEKIKKMRVPTIQHEIRVPQRVQQPSYSEESLPEFDDQDESFDY